MTWDALARHVEGSGAEDFANPLGYDLSLPALEEAKAMIVHALRFAAFHEISWPPPRPSDYYKPTVTTGLSENGIG